MKLQKLSVLEKIGYGSGDAAVNVVISSMFHIISFFYTDVFGLKPKDMALMFLLVRFIDVITDPLMGLITDKFTTKWGRYRPLFSISLRSIWPFSFPYLHYSGFRLCW